jgi:hypothetical protein
MFMLRGAGLGDYIDANDPCTLNPSDPICQATASDVANDPCRANPYASYCQASINQQAASLPTPGSNDSQWNQYVDGSSGWGAAAATAAAAAAAIVAGQPKPPAITGSVPGSTGAAASLSNIGMPNKYVLGALAIVGGFLLVRRRNQMRSAKKAA